MYVKKCDKCSKLSYSSCPTSTWICPHTLCGKDITHLQAVLESELRAGAEDRVVQFLSL